MGRLFQQDAVAEWLRRWTANPLCSAREGSNPFGVGFLGDFLVDFIENLEKPTEFNSDLLSTSLRDRNILFSLNLSLNALTSLFLD